MLATTLWLGYQQDADAADFSYGQRLFSIGDYAGALHVWQPLADDGDPRAQYAIALMYAKGMGLETDLDQAGTWARKAADQDFGPAKALLTMLTDLRGDAAAASATAAAGSEEARIEALIVAIIEQFSGSLSGRGDLSHSGIKVEATGSGYRATVTDVALKGQQGQLADIGTLRMHVTVPDPHHYAVVLALPEVIYLRDEQKRMSRIDIGRQASSLLWNRELNTSTDFSFVFGDVELSADGRPGRVGIREITAVAEIRPDGTRWSGPFRFGLNGVEIVANGDTSAGRIGELSVELSFEGLDLPRYMQAVREVQADAGDGGA